MATLTKIVTPPPPPPPPPPVPPPVVTYTLSMSEEEAKALTFLIGNGTVGGMTNELGLHDLWMKLYQTIGTPAGGSFKVGNRQFRFDRLAFLISSPSPFPIRGV